MKYVIGIALVSIFVLIILTIYKKIVQDKLCICKACKNTINQSDIFCKKCGKELMADDKEIIIKKSNRKLSIGIYTLLGIIIFSGVLTVYLYSKNGDLLYDLSGSTGVYASKYDNTLSDADYWIVDCEALSGGIFKKSVRSDSLKNLIVEGKTVDGQLILTAESGKTKKEFDISDTNGEVTFDMGDFKSGLLKLSISHPKSEHIFVCVKWQ